MKDSKRKSRRDGSDTTTSSKRDRDRDDRVRVKERNRTRDRCRYVDDANVENHKYMHRGDKDRNTREKDKERVRTDREKRPHSGEEDKEKKRRRRDDDDYDKRRNVKEETRWRSKRDDDVAILEVVKVKSGNTWTLDGESDDEESAPDVKSTINVMDDKDEVDIDPLDAYMDTIAPQVENLTQTVPCASNKLLKKGATRSVMGRIIQGEDSDSDYDIEDESDKENVEQQSNQMKKTKVEKFLSTVDHSEIDYPRFRKNFYTEVKEIERMTPEEVTSYRLKLELKIHGKNVPKPIKSWHQTGLSTKILNTTRKLKYEKPMPIQAQALPIIMSGRDCIGIAKTGSGKTLAFVLPMLRHIKDQPPLMSGDGPIGLIIAPTRELVKQIYSDIKKFIKGSGLTCVPVIGGSEVAQQYKDLKRGAEIVVCTPGRMIDVLCTGTNLRRVTYLVIDEADRMFDMGFEPQITRIIQNTRPDRQTVLFSATFPCQFETLARKVLSKPVEIQVGDRSVVNKDITHFVEVRPESDRFLRLLELLGEWYDKGKVLVFVNKQDKCDSLFKDLLKTGYPCLPLHGGKDQTDRESTLADFKNDVCNLLIATSVAARGLDVKELELVVNFDVPDHYEEYVHRVGRTGRAGRKGCAVTFISEEDARYAPDLVQALEKSEQSVPADLKALADAFNVKVNQGSDQDPTDSKQRKNNGYNGRGFKFNEEEDKDRKAAKKDQAKQYLSDEDISDSEDADDSVGKTSGDVKAVPNDGLAVSLPGVVGLTVPQAVPISNNNGAAMAAALVALKHNLAKIQADSMPEHYEAELEINDYPQNARFKVMHKETLGIISEWTGAAITTRGQYCEPGKVAGKKLYLFIEGPTEQSVKNAKAELKHVLEDFSTQASFLPGSARQPVRYSVV